MVYIKKVGEKIYVVTDKDGRPCEDPPIQHVQSKNFIIKVMFLVAVARPRGDWDGKIGIWPVTEPYVTQRASHRRPAGVTEQRPVTIDRPKARKMLLEDVIPAIMAKWPQDQKYMAIRIQQDNAKPHVLDNDAEVLAAGGADGWDITLATKKSWRCQPAQSPDFNVLDLGFFNCIQSLQNQTRPGSIEDLIAEVERAFEATPRDSLDRTFLTLQSVLEKTLLHDGKNDFKLGHLKKGMVLRLLGRLPAYIWRDAEVYQRALDRIKANGEADPVPPLSSVPPPPPPPPVSTPMQTATTCEYDVIF